MDKSKEDSKNKFLKTIYSNVGNTNGKNDPKETVERLIKKKDKESE